MLEGGRKFWGKKSYQLKKLSKLSYRKVQMKLVRV